MEYVLWALIISLFILSFIGLVFPIIPSVLVIWGGFLLYFFSISKDELSVLFWIVMILFTVILFVADILANSYFVKKYGGSKWGERMAAVGVIVGSFIFPPFGLIIVPFIMVFITEMLQKKTKKESFLASFGSLLGFLSGTFAKVFVQLIMIIWFFIEVFI